MRKHRLQAGEWVKVGLWCVLAAIPAGLLGLCLALAPVRAAGGRGIEAMVGPLAGVALIVAAALYVIANRIAEIQHKSRRGRACIACAYEMSEDPMGTCPECGIE